MIVFVASVNAAGRHFLRADGTVDGRTVTVFLDRNTLSDMTEDEARNHIAKYMASFVARPYPDLDKIGGQVSL